MMKINIIYGIIMLLIGSVMFDSVTMAEETIGGQLSTNGTISFYDNEPTDELPSEGTANSGILPKTADVPMINEMMLSGLFIIICLGRYVFWKYRKRGVNDET